MRGCSRSARIRRSSRKRRRPTSPAAALPTNLSATRWLNCDGSRSARYTTPIPPWPSSRMMRNGPARSGASGAPSSISTAPNSEADDARNFSDRSCESRSAATSARTDSSGHSRSRKVRRSATGRSSAASKSASTWRKRSCADGDVDACGGSGAEGSGVIVRHPVAPRTTRDTTSCAPLPSRVWRSGDRCPAPRPSLPPTSRRRSGIR